jgi:hypothetical protein
VLGDGVRRGAKSIAAVPANFLKPHNPHAYKRHGRSVPQINSDLWVE